MPRHFALPEDLAELHQLTSEGGTLDPYNNCTCAPLLGCPHLDLVSVCRAVTLTFLVEASCWFT